MPANLTPEYFKAEKWFRSATTAEEKVLALEHMLAVIPKHKGTDHLRADLRKKLSKLKEHGDKKTAAKHTDIFHIVHGGSGQIALLGMPNCGKSSIVALLTNAKVHVADFPYATTMPVPGMMKFENVQIQLVDMPPITADYCAPGQVGAYRNCDIIGIVVDVSADVEEQLLVLLDFLESRRLLIDENTHAVDAGGNALGKKAFCLCSKYDIAADGAYDKVRQFVSERFDCIKVSTEIAELIEKLPGEIFRQLGIIRVYAKPPGKKPDMDEPFTLTIGSNVQDLARAIHRELAEKLKYARIWGKGVYDGQNCQRTHVLSDGDIIELHFS